MQKVIFVVCDGLSDRPITELGGKTPLEAAKKPNLNKLASKGMLGAMNTVDIGIRPGSDTSHLALFGYDPMIYYSGRGPFEAAGIGMDLKEGDVAFRANMGTVDDNLVVIDRRAGRIDSTELFAKLLNKTKIDDVTFYLKAGTGHRLGLVMSGPNLSPKISDCDPHDIGKKIKKAEPKNGSKEEKHTAEVLNKFLEYSYKKIKDLPLNKERIKKLLPPANYILVRGPGGVPKIPSFKEKYGLSACCIAGAGLYRGIAKVLGMEIVKVPGATGKPDSNLENKVKAVIHELKNFDFIFLHIKGADTLGEDGNYLGKKMFIEKIDKAVKPLIKLKNVLIIITADHSTPCALKKHSADDVPVLICGEGVRSDDLTIFDERTCYRGRLGHIKGLNLMPIIIDLMGLAELFGA